MTVGLPRSGKTTWANQQGLPVVSSDEIRERVPESQVWKTARADVEQLFKDGHNCVILDATNVTAARRNYWLNPQWNCEYVVFEPDVDLCVERAKSTRQPHLIPAIHSMNKKWDF